MAPSDDVYTTIDVFHTRNSCYDGRRTVALSIDHDARARTTPRISDTGGESTDYATPTGHRTSGHSSHSPLSPILSRRGSPGRVDARTAVPTTHHLDESRARSRAHLSKRTLSRTGGMAVHSPWHVCVCATMAASMARVSPPRAASPCVHLSSHRLYPAMESRSLVTLLRRRQRVHRRLHIMCGGGVGGGAEPTSRLPHRARRPHCVSLSSGRRRTRYAKAATCWGACAPLRSPLWCGWPLL